MTGDSSPMVSIIITTRNEAAVIEKLLQSVCNQTYKNIEIILVDNYSTDSTIDIANKYVNKLILLGPERSTQRNRGVCEASGQYVLILDADMELAPSVVEEAVSIVTKESSIKAILIPEFSFGINYWARCKALERNCYIDNFTDVAGARFFNKETFLQVGGYDESITGPEDWDLSQRFEEVTEFKAIKSLIYHHEGYIDLRKQIKKKFYYALKLRTYINKHPNKFLKQANFLFRPAYFRHWRDLAQQPHLAIGMFFLRFCEGLAGIAGMFRGYFAN
jgi:glycosyltransferase involved in cell wall biosynthesis